MTSESPQWVREEQARIAAEEKNRPEFLKLEPSELVEVTIDTSSGIQIKKDKWDKQRARLTVMKDGKKLFWDVAINNPTYKKLIDGLAEGQTKFKLLRIGKGPGSKIELAK